jgi:flavorubredoxin
MAQTLTHPKTRLEPTRIAPETFIIHNHEGEGVAPAILPVNSLVIRSKEPVVVDTGFAHVRDEYLADLFSVVEPEDIRWVFISHDDVDHTGNVNALMEAAPNATLIIDWFMMERMGGTLEVPPLRQRWVRDGEVLDVGDRKLLTVRPPIFDSPTTRGLFDTTTGVYWASDSFATTMDTVVRSVTDLDADAWNEGMPHFNRWVSPWLELVDDAKFQKTVDRIEQLQASVIAGCHTPAIPRSHIATALAATRRSPQVTDVMPQPDQEVLDQIQLAMMAAQ